MNKKGFTLIELIVTVAVLAILASVFVMSNLNAMEKQRKEADVVAMEQIDGYLKEILINEDIFDEIKNNQDAILEQSADSNIKNTLILNFIVQKDGDNGCLFIDDSGTTMTKIGTGATMPLYAKCPLLYTYLCEYFDGTETEPGKIPLTSANYKEGTYVVKVEFNAAQISENRPSSISNDSVFITNSGGESLYRKK